MAGEDALRGRAIGTVIVGRPQPEASSRGDGGPAEPAVAEIEIKAAWVEALDGIEEFSHIWVLWWLDRFEDPPVALHVHPERRQELPLVGLFATRSPHRPFPIGLTAVRLLERQGGWLVVEGLDAFEGTIVLDIKPYLRRGDLIAEASAPAWLERLWKIRDEEHKE